MLSRPIIIAGFGALAIVAIVVGANLVRDLFRERSQLAREQRAREDRERAEDRARSDYERDLGYIGRVFDPIGLFTT